MSTAINQLCVLKLQTRFHNINKDYFLQLFQINQFLSEKTFENFLPQSLTGQRGEREVLLNEVLLLMNKESVHSITGAADSS